jgi:hypothetical protein
MLNQHLLHILVDAAKYLHRKYDLEVVHLSSVIFVGRALPNIQHTTFKH